MSKQQGYQQLSTDAPYGAEYGFAARLPQAGESYGQTDKASSSGGAAGVSPMAYPAPVYAGAPVTGYPVMAPSMAGGMAGPVGMGVEDPLGRGDRRARRQAKRMARGANGGGRRKPSPVLMLVGGPVGLLVGLARRAIHMGKEHVGKQHPAPAGHPGSSNQPARHPRS